jgi:hypothetical protein
MGAATRGSDAFTMKTSSYVDASSPVSSGAIFEAEGTGGSITLSSYLVPADDAVVKLNWPDSSTWINSGSTLPTYDSADGSWVFNRSKSQYFDAGARTWNPQSSGFTVTARVMVSQVGFFRESLILVQVQAYKQYYILAFVGSKQSCTSQIVSHLVPNSYDHH